MRTSPTQISLFNMWNLLLSCLIVSSLAPSLAWTADIAISSVPVISTDVVIKNHVGGDIVVHLEIYSHENPWLAVKTFCRNYHIPYCGYCQELLAVVHTHWEHYYKDAGVPIPAYESEVIESISKSTEGLFSFVLNIETVHGVSERFLFHQPVEVELYDALQSFCALHKLPNLQCTYLRDMLRIKVQRWQGHEEVTLSQFFSSYQCGGNIVMQGMIDKTPFSFQVGEYPDKSIDDLCLKYSLRRENCLRIARAVSAEVRQWFGYPGELGGSDLYCYILVLETLELLMQEKQGSDDSALLRDLDFSGHSHNIDVDFIEIGTSNAQTICQHINGDETVIGYSIEPSKVYLEQLPSHPGVQKVNAAITGHSRHIAAGKNSVDFYWIPYQTIIDEQLPPNIAGLNSINNYHVAHINRNLTHLVQIESVPLLPIDKFLMEQHIRRIKLLKIDTEGHDAIILRGLYEYIKDTGSNILYMPTVIMFENNGLSDGGDVSEVLDLFVGEFNYTLKFSGMDVLISREV